MMFFRFERREQKPVEYQTLADLPEGVRCVVTHSHYPHQTVKSRKGDRGINTEKKGPLMADECVVVQILDPIPVPPLPNTLADVEEGRCMMMTGHVGNHFRYGNMLLCHVPENGLIKRAGANSFESLQSLTDIYAVACEVGP